MPFIPHNTHLHKIYAGEVADCVNVRHGAGDDWPSEMYVLAGHSDYIRTVAFSPDGACIVSGSDDKSVRVRNAMTG